MRPRQQQIKTATAQPTAFHQEILTFHFRITQIGEK
jgi:hypothetical protein